MTSEPPPKETGSIRFNVHGKVEVYDGTEWKPYGSVNDTDEPPNFREHDLPGPM